MSNTLQISFQIKNTKLNKKNLAPVYCRITVDGVRKEFSIGRRIEPSKRNKLGYAEGKNEDAKSLNAYLTALRMRLNEDSMLCLRIFWD